MIPLGVKRPPRPLNHGGVEVHYFGEEAARASSGPIRWHTSRRGDSNVVEPLQAPGVHRGSLWRYCISTALRKYPAKIPTTPQPMPMTTII